jgi:hypothetical protein
MVQHEFFSAMRCKNNGTKEMRGTFWMLALC